MGQAYAFIGLGSVFLVIALVLFVALNSKFTEMRVDYEICDFDLFEKYVIDKELASADTTDFDHKALLTIVVNTEKDKINGWKFYRKEPPSDSQMLNEVFNPIGIRVRIKKIVED